MPTSSNLCLLDRDGFGIVVALSRLGYAPPPVVSMNARRAISGTRTAFETRRCQSLPDSHSRYTVAVQTRSRSATSRTVSKGPVDPQPPPRFATAACSTDVANGGLPVLFAATDEALTRRINTMLSRLC